METRHVRSLRLAHAQGHTEVLPGFHLFARHSLLRDQPSWDSDDSLTRFDFSPAPFWLMSMGMDPVAIHAEDDLRILEEGGCLTGLVDMAHAGRGARGRHAIAAHRQGH